MRQLQCTGTAGMPVCSYAYVMNTFTCYLYRGTITIASNFELLNGFDDRPRTLSPSLFSNCMCEAIVWHVFLFILICSISNSLIESELCCLFSYVYNNVYMLILCDFLPGLTFTLYSLITLHKYKKWVLGGANVNAFESRKEMKWTTQNQCELGIWMDPQKTNAFSNASAIVGNENHLTWLWPVILQEILYDWSRPRPFLPLDSFDIKLL